jgi:hypothetical protein
LMCYSFRKRQPAPVGAGCITVVAAAEHRRGNRAKAGSIPTGEGKEQA